MTQEEFDRICRYQTVWQKMYKENRAEYKLQKNRDEKKSKTQKKTSGDILTLSGCYQQAICVQCGRREKISGISMISTFRADVITFIYYLLAKSIVSLNFEQNYNNEFSSRLEIQQRARMGARRRQ